jgi:hypothetical protein
MRLRLGRGFARRAAMMPLLLLVPSPPPPPPTPAFLQMQDFQFFDQEKIKALFQREFELTNQKRSILHHAKDLRSQVAKERRAASKATGETGVASHEVCSADYSSLSKLLHAMLSRQGKVRDVMLLGKSTLPSALRSHGSPDHGVHFQ